MIKNHFITYAAAHSPLQSFEFSSVTITALVIALLTTVLSYQATVILYDLTLGLKPRGFALVRNLHSLLLSRQSSPFAILDALARNDSITRLRLRLAPESFISRHESKVHPFVALKLVLLVVVAPICSILTIAMTLETTETLTFSQAGFGGMALDINPDQSVVETRPFLDICQRAKFADTNEITVSTQFLLCHTNSTYTTRGILDPSAYPDFSDWQDIAFMDIFIAQGSVMILIVGLNGQISERIVDAPTQTLDGMLLLQIGTNLEAQRRLATIGIELLAKECGLQNASTAEPLSPYVKGKAERLLGFVISCPRATEAAEAVVAVNRINRQLGQLPTLVNTDRLILCNTTIQSLGDDYRCSDGGGRNFVRRRTRFVSLPILAIITGVSVLLRIIVKTVCSSDLEDGLEKLIKDKIGVNQYCSLMRAGGREIYYHSEQCGGREPVDVVGMVSATDEDRK